MITLGAGEAAAALAVYHIYLAAVIKRASNATKSTTLIKPTAPVLNDDQKQNQRRRINSQLKVYNGHGKIEETEHTSTPWSV
jgi:hypothetical protein